MALRCTRASSQYVSKTTGMLDFSTTYSVMMWVKLETDVNDFIDLMDITASGSNTYDHVGTTNDGTTLSFEIATGGTPGSGTGTSLTVGTWYHVAMVADSATTTKVYLNGVEDIAVTHDTRSGRSANDRQSYNNIVIFGAANSGNTSIAAIKEYSAALTPAEIVQEMRSIAPRRLANLNAWYPMIDSTLANTIKDFSGNARDLTGTNTPTTSDGPPVSWGAYMPMIPEGAGGGGGGGSAYAIFYIRA